MPIWRIVYNKICAEKNDTATKSVEVKTNTNIKKIRKEKVGKGAMLAIDFGLETEYKPDVGHVIIEGTVFYASEKLDEIMKKDGKKISLEAEAMKEVHTAILREPVIIAINASRNLGLPLPISFPKVQVEKAKKKKTKKRSKK